MRDGTPLEGCVVSEAGIEPATPSLEGSCSIRLSYSPLPIDCTGRGELPRNGSELVSCFVTNEIQKAKTNATYAKLDAQDAEFRAGRRLYCEGVR